MKVDIKLLSGEGITVDVKNNGEILRSIRQFIVTFMNRKTDELESDGVAVKIKYNNFMDAVDITCEDKVYSWLDLLSSNTSNFFYNDAVILCVINSDIFSTYEYGLKSPNSGSMIKRICEVNELALKIRTNDGENKF